MPGPAEAPVAFARLLRRRGLDVPGTAVLSFTEALAVLDVRRPDATYWAGPGHPRPPVGGHRRVRPGLRRLLDRPRRAG